MVYDDFLVERASKFLENAKYLFSKEVYDISAFNVEQFCQLLLKHKISKLVGDFPKTHSIKKLIDDLIKITGSEKLKKFKEENISTIGNIENAYIVSRYLPSTFERKEVEVMLKFADSLKKLVDEL